MHRRERPARGGGGKGGGGGGRHTVVAVRDIFVMKAYAASTVVTVLRQTSGPACLSAARF